MAAVAPGSGQSAELAAMAQSARYVDEAGQALAAIRGRVQQDRASVNQVAALLNGHAGDVIK